MEFTGERFVPEKTHLQDEIEYEHLHRYYAATSMVRGAEVLDLACGEGYGAAILANLAARVTGVDIDAGSIYWATEKYAGAYSNLAFRQGSATAIPLPSSSFDVVVSFETIEHIDSLMQEQFMQEIKRVLRPGGILLMSTPDKKNYTDRYDHHNTFHVKEFYRDEFAAFIKTHFPYTAFFDQGYEIMSVISNTATENAPAINLYSWNEKKNTDRKYIIAVASDSALPAYTSEIASIVPGADKDFLTLMDRLIQMNKEIEGLGNWGNTLNATLEEKGGILQQKDQEILRLNDFKARLQLEAVTKDQLAAVLQQKLNEKELLAAELHQKLHQQYQEANTVKERLSEIYDSDGWRLLRRYYTLKGKMLPENSRTYKQLKKLYHLLRFKRILKTEQYTAAEKINRPSSITIPVVFPQLTIPAFDHPTVSIVIPAYNAWPMNYQCIESIINGTAGIAYEIILADDNSADDTRSAPDVIKNLVHARSEKNQGFLKNCNYAAGFARGKYILFLNNDTKVSPNWLAPLVSLIESDASIGMVGSKLLYPDGRLQEAGGIIWDDASGWNYGHQQDPQLPEFNYVKEVDYISGACILIRLEAWTKAGGFDERYSPAYCEDSDFAFTLRSMGYKVMYQPLSEVTHYEGYSHGTETTVSDDSNSIKSYQKINNVKFFEKWQSVLTTGQLPNAQNVFQARDRSTRKKTMLVIDHYVPHFDKDAGSKTTFQYLDLFTSMGLNIKFIGDNFFKHEPYTEALQQMGIEVLYGPWYRDNWQQWVTENTAHIDYIYINRPHIAIKYIDFLKKATKATILYYGHDLHYLREMMQYEVEKDPALLKSADKWKALETYLFEQSDIILTPSLDEKKIISGLSSAYRVETILPYFFKTIARPVTEFSTRSGLLFVGGFAHTPNIDAVEWFCREVWPLVIAALPAVRFTVVGSNPPDNIKNLQSSSIEIKGFVSDSELANLYERSKIGVIPVRYGAGVKGKTVEAMYHGLPIVSTAFGIEGMPGDYLHFLQPKNDAAAFATEIIRLYDDNEALQRLSAAGAAYINANFTRQAAAEHMKSLLELTD